MQVRNSSTKARVSTNVRRFSLITFAMVAAITASGSAERKPVVRIAVAANFISTASKLERRFEAANDVKVELVTGASGTHYAQILNGAPFDLFLSADSHKPRSLADEALIASSPRTYAIGSLVLWDPNGRFESLDAAKAGIKGGASVAIANPRLAPYGLAAVETMASWDLPESGTKRVTMQNVSQAFQAAESGNVDLAFVAEAQTKAGDSRSKGHVFVIEPTLYSPIRQDAVLLKSAIDDKPARDFFRYLLSDEAQAFIVADGYRSGPSH